MIISCENCSKTFNVKDELIPNNGRMLKCSKCGHKWFFKKKFENNNNFQIEGVSIDKIKVNKDLDFKNTQSIDTIEKKSHTKKVQSSKKNYNYLKIFIVIIISIIAFIVILDTFKNQLTLIFPNLSEILNNLYESLTDLKLFIKDLIK